MSAWPSALFGDLFTFIRNGMNVRQDRSGRGLPITRIETIADGVVDGARVGFAGLAETDCKEWLLAPGDLLLSHINSVSHVGKCALYKGAPEKLVHGMNLLCLRCDPARLMPRFATYLIRSSAFRAALSPSIKRAVNQASVSISDLRQIAVQLPPVPEQRRIADILDRADAMRAKRREAIALLDVLGEATFVELFAERGDRPWPRVQLSDLLTAIESGWSPTCLERTAACEEWGVLKLGAVTWGEFDQSENKALPGNVEPDASIEVKPGDLLMVRKNTYGLVGNCCLVGPTRGRLMMSDLIFRLKIASPAEVDPVYLCRALQQAPARRALRSMAGGTAGSMPNISKGRLMTLAVPMPPIEIQREFAGRVAVIDRLKAAHRASLAEMDALFASLQHRAFRGEL